MPACQDYPPEASAATGSGGRRNSRSLCVTEEMAAAQGWLGDTGAIGRVCHGIQVLMNNPPLRG